MKASTFKLSLCWQSIVYPSKESYFGTSIIDGLNFHFENIILYIIDYTIM